MLAPVDPKTGDAPVASVEHPHEVIDAPASNLQRRNTRDRPTNRDRAECLAREREPQRVLHGRRAFMISVIDDPPHWSLTFCRAQD